MEILQEAAQSYFAACKKMVAALEALRAFDGAAVSGTADGDRPTRRAQLLDEAAGRVYSVLVQREAMKLSGSETFLNDYGIPKEVIARMGQLPRP